MNQEQNNFNTQGSNDVPNNQSLNTTHNMGYNSQTIQFINKPQKKKFKWWIPVLILLSGVLMCVISIIMEMEIRAQNELILDYQITNYPEIMIFRWLAIICWLMVIPSLIIIIIKYNKKILNTCFIFKLDIHTL